MASYGRRWAVVLFACSVAVLSCGGTNSLDGEDGGGVDEIGSGGDDQACAALEASPAVLDFGRAADTCVSRSLVVRNTGECPVDIDDLFLSGSFDYFFSEGADEDPVAVDLELPVTLGVGESLELQISRCGPGGEVALFLRSDTVSGIEVTIR